jgi:hypothetical protein
MPEAGQTEIRRLVAARDGLLHLHKALLEAQRHVYEKIHGPVGSAGQFLQLAIYDPAFDWLHRFSELIVQIDETTEGDVPVSTAQLTSLLDQVNQLFHPDNREFHQTLLTDPASANVYRSLTQLLAGS